jgi:hypothetical protein
MLQIVTVKYLIFAADKGESFPKYSESGFSETHPNPSREGIFENKIQ